MSDKKRPRLPARRAGETAQDYQARVLTLISDEPVTTAGRPSMVQLVFCAAHAALRSWTLYAAAPPSQRQLLKATKTVLDRLHERMPSWPVPSPNTIRKHVQCFLRWRLGMSDDTLCALPPDQYEALSDGAAQLPDDMVHAMLRGYVGTLEPQTDKPMDLDTAMTRQIQSITTLKPR